MILYFHYLIIYLTIYHLRYVLRSLNPYQVIIDNLFAINNKHHRMDRNNSQSQPNRKVANFRNSIRREQIQTYFQQRRRQLQQQKQQSNASQIIQSLRLNKSRQTQFLNNCSRELTGQPSVEWIQTIKQLKTFSQAFDANFSQWISLSIIKNLALTLKQSSTIQRLIPEICNLLSDLVYLSYKNDTNFPDKLMEYQISNNIINHGLNHFYPLHERMLVLQLCTNLSQYKIRYRIQFLKQGMGIWLLQLGGQIISNRVNQVLVKRYLVCLRSFITIQNKINQHKQHTNLNLIVKVIPLLSQLIVNYNTDRELSNCMQIFIDIIKYNRQPIFSTVFQVPLLIRNIIALIVANTPQLRLKVLYVLSLISYCEKLQVMDQLLEMRVLDNIFQAYYEMNSRQSYTYGRTVMICLSNISCDSERNKNIIFEHPIFQIVIDQLSHSQIKNKSEGFYCLNTIVCKLRLNSFEVLLGKYQILHHLTLGLNEFRSANADTCIQIINALTNIVNRSQAIYHPSGNPVVDQLQKTYNVVPILEDISQNCKNTLLRQQTDILHQLIAKIQWSHLSTI